MILETVKKAMLIPLEENYADSELENYISSCKELLICSGVSNDIVNEQKNALVDSLIIIYCKTFFGFKNDGSVKELPKSFDLLLKQLVLTQSYH